MTDGRRTPRAALGWLLLFAAVAPAGAQLSPGPLAAPHAALEGSANCLECHSSGKGVDPERCLSCHAGLAERIAAGRGLHARSEYADCKSCHIDHHGRDFELVWWGEAGRAAFDHGLTGHRLEGRHAELDCRQCHRTELNRAGDRLRRQGTNLARTFLGLGTECLACHRDEHRGQFEPGTCLDCHAQTAWRPADGFAHETTRFPLTGRHRDLGCERCHVTVAELQAGDADFMRFAGLAFGRCTDCHTDPHAGRFGVACEECHSTAGWRRVASERFDHDRTRYPLRGRHLQVACEACHRPGSAKRGLAFAQCTDCHGDEHAGQFAARADGGRCDSCHTVDGFLPPLYDLPRHDEVFALSGAHRELACERCHTRVERSILIGEGVVAAGAAAGRGDLVRFRFPSTACQDCHDDPHRGTTAEVAAAAGCTLCHGTASWQEAVFDHAATGFELRGPHARLGCEECHVRAAGDGLDLLEFAGLGTDCAACHEDPHQGQFAAADGRVDCLRCHALEAWRPAPGFDHQRDTEFPLLGAHARVACAGCHLPESGAGGDVVRYRALPRTCSACHAG